MIVPSPAGSATDSRARLRERMSSVMGFAPLSGVDDPRALGQQGMRQRVAGAHRGGDNGRFRQFLPACACAEGTGGMHVDAIFALGGERDRDHFADLQRNCAIGAGISAKSEPSGVRGDAFMSAAPFASGLLVLQEALQA